jgi:hypothetical protein
MYRFLDKSIDDICYLVTVVDGVFLLHLVLGELDHFSSERRHTLGDLETGQLADLGSGEAVHRVRADLQGKLTTIKNLNGIFTFGVRSWSN